MVQLSSSDYAADESTGEVCLIVEVNSTSSEPFSVYVMPIVNHPISATSKSICNDVYLFIDAWI